MEELNDIGILCCYYRKLLEPTKENMDPNLLPVKQMKGLLSSGVAIGLIEEKNSKQSNAMLWRTLYPIIKLMPPHSKRLLMLVGVSRKGYSSIFHAISSTLKDQRIKIGRAHV